MENKLRDIMAGGEAALGTFFATGSADLVEIAALCGFDFCVIDCEHGPLSVESAQQLIRAAQLRGMTPVVRVPDGQASTVLHALDVGAMGVQVPQINDAKAAADTVRGAKYPPLGVRGTAFPRGADYGLGSGTDYFAEANQKTLVIVHCETVESLDRLDEICAVPGIDVVFLGPYDMSASMGIAGQVDHPRVEAAAARILEITARHGIAAGIYAGSGAKARARARQGFRYITVGMDTVLFSTICKQVVGEFQEGV